MSQGQISYGSNYITVAIPFTTFIDGPKIYWIAMSYGTTPATINTVMALYTFFGSFMEAAYLHVLLLI